MMLEDAKKSGEEGFEENGDEEKEDARTIFLQLLRVISMPISFKSEGLFGHHQL